MKKILAAVTALSAGLALVAHPVLARFDLEFASQSASGGTAYEWYSQDIPFSFDSARRDGVMPTGEPYTLFKGSDASPNGHCLEVAMRPGASSLPYLQVKVNDHGTYRVISNPNFATGGYSTIRLWVHRNINSGSLNWALYFVANDGNTGFSGEIRVDVRRLEVSKSGCTTNQVGGVADPSVNPMPWVAFEGNSGNYTITKGNF